jgi:cell division protein FtsQ
MKAERDIAIPQRRDSSSASKGRAKSSGLFKFGRKPARRGEKEASNLLWRRRFKIVERVFTLVLIAGLAGISFEAWRGGAFNLVGASVETGLNRLVVKAGLTVEEVRIKGQNRTPLGQIREALELHPHQSVFAVNLDEARQRVEKLNWVKEASVSRQLPNAIEVNITERAPFALWQDQGHMWLIDADGVQLTDRNLDEFARLPQVVGDGAPEKAATLLAMLKSNPTLFTRVKAAVRVSGRRWDLIMKNGVRVRLPDEDESGAYLRLATFQKDQQILERNIAVVDLRFPDRLVVALDHDAPLTDLRTSDDTGPSVKGDAPKKPEAKGNIANARAGAAPVHHRGREI